ncbi:MAG: aldose 1-epimerase family protein [Ornithinimicrobium sp.]
MELTLGSNRAMLHTAGAALQSLVVEGRDLVVGYPPGPERAGFRGALLLPWPNRLRDGCYEFDGVEYQAALNEVSRRNALHGLLAWTEFAVLERTQDTARLHATVPVQPAYPSRLEVEVLLELVDDGLRTTVRSVNVGDRPAPYGVSSHPYLSCGTGMVDDWTLRVDADSVVEVDERMLPTGRLLDAAQIGLDFRNPVSLRDVQLDHCFRRVGDGHSTWAELRAPDGGGVRITAPGTWARWWQAFTSDTTPGALHRAAVALEPMTCPPDAFNTGEAMVLEAGAQHEVSWMITAV